MVGRNDNIKAVIWDLDGVVVDTMPDIVNALRVAARAVGYGELSDEQTRGKVGGGAVKAFQLLFGDDGAQFVQPAVEHFAEYYPKHCADTSQLYPGVSEVLAGLGGRVRFAMATAKIRPASLMLLETLGVRDYFDYVVTADDMQRMKPDPQSVQMILERFGLSGDQAVMIGDMKTDILAGRAAGVHTIGVTYGYGTAADLTAAGAEALVGAPSELIDVINSL
ncbi:HAD family hydrolase [Propionicicella superfundia]|uniref:HAD family hydrolase n=1 Tax=Propionicicella superfundia TaxID=348582 RepID=UPI0003FBF9E9|nr:HAD-IA family hydrolase [Propionicicella superfundia]